jgi:Trk K+ transport system NAD-binding subunit
LFGDATDPEFLAHLPLGNAEWLVMAVPEHDTGVTHDDPRFALLKAARDLGFEGRVAVAAHREVTAEALSRINADIVMMPYRDAAYAAANMIAGRAAPSLPGLQDPEGQKELPA